MNLLFLRQLPRRDVQLLREVLAVEPEVVVEMVGQRLELLLDEDAHLLDEVGERDEGPGVEERVGDADVIGPPGLLEELRELLERLAKVPAYRILGSWHSVLIERGGGIDRGWIVAADGSAQIETALQNVPKGTLMVDTFYTDLFGRNLTCSPDSIFRKT